MRELHSVVEQAYLFGPEKQLRAVDISIPTADLSAEEEKINSRSKRLFKALVRSSPFSHTTNVRSTFARSGINN